MSIPSAGRRALLCASVTAAVACGAVPAAAATAGEPSADVTAAPYNAVGDGVTNDRLAIQQAIDDIGAAGGGEVVIPAGRTFLTGSVMLRSGVTLRLDGTLRQSQEVADYGKAPIPGLDMPTDIPWHRAYFHNDPLVGGVGVHDVALVGRGLLQMTVLPDHTRRIDVIPVGFFEARRFAVRGITIREARTTILTMLHSSDGTVANIDVATSRDLGADGIVVSGSQRVKVLHNKVRTSDDGIVLETKHLDPRDVGSWWSSATSTPLHDVEIAFNDIENFGTRNAIAFLPWASTPADKRDAAISDLWIHDNRLVSLNDTYVNCDCDNPFNPERRPFIQAIRRGEQAPMTRVVWERNNSSGQMWPFYQWVPPYFTDSRFDIDRPNVHALMNGDFEQTAAVWWSPEGNAGATDRAADVPEAAEAAFAQRSGRLRRLPRGAARRAGRPLPGDRVQERGRAGDEPLRARHQSGLHVRGRRRHQRPRLRARRARHLQRQSPRAPARRAAHGPARAAADPRRDELRACARRDRADRGQRRLGVDRQRRARDAGDRLRGSALGPERDVGA